MTPEQIRVVIAEKAGWKWLPNPHILHPSRLCWWVAPHMQTLPGYGVGCADVECPDYPHDLNAVHQIVKALPEQESREYFFQWLPKVVCPNVIEPKSYRLANAAEAIQCCEALLRTWGLWKEDK